MQRLARVEEVEGLVCGHFAAVPQVGPVRGQLCQRGGGHNLESRLSLSALVGKENPTEAWLGRVDSQRINAVFTSQSLDPYGLRLAAHRQAEQEDGQRDFQKGRPL